MNDQEREALLTVIDYIERGLIVNNHGGRDFDFVGQLEAQARAALASRQEVPQGRCAAPPCKCWSNSQRAACAYWHAAASPQPAPAAREPLTGSFWRKKPVVIEAHQWDGTESGIQRIKALFPALETLAKTGHLRKEEVTRWRIGTLEGGHDVSAGDWIIKGVKGEFYPCKPEIFQMTYERAHGIGENK